jgi:hypothetical protein
MPRSFDIVRWESRPARVWGAAAGPPASYRKVCSLGRAAARRSRSVNGYVGCESFRYEGWRVWVSVGLTALCVLVGRRLRLSHPTRLFAPVRWLGCARWWAGACCTLRDHRRCAGRALPDGQILSRLGKSLSDFPVALVEARARGAILPSGSRRASWALSNVAPAAGKQVRGRGGRRCLRLAPSDCADSFTP